MRLKVDHVGDNVGKIMIMTISQEAGNDLDDFELFQAVGNENGQLIIRSIRNKMFIHVSKAFRLFADMADPENASKFVLKSR